MARSKAEIEAEKKKERLRELRRGPDLEQFLEGRKRKFTTYAQGASMYSMNYYSFITLQRKQGQIFRSRKR